MNHVYIHPTANISDLAKIGQDTKVWINVQIRENAEIGKQCIISKDVYIDHGVKIGDRCKIQNSVSIYHGVILGDDVFIGPNATFTNDRVPRAFNTDWKISPTIVESGASIGANSTIVCGVVIGCYAMIAAGSVVTRNVPAYALVMGNPARTVAYVCQCGNRLDNLNQCRACGKTISVDGLEAHP